MIIKVDKEGSEAIQNLLHMALQKEGLKFYQNVGVFLKSMELIVPEKVASIVPENSTPVIEE